jgi:VanZ family protein
VGNWRFGPTHSFAWEAPNRLETVMKIRLPLLPVWVRWTFVTCVAGFIFYTSILTSPPTYVDPAKPDLLPLDKWRHFVAYAVFGGALAYASADWTVKWKYTAIFVIGTVIIYGVGIEFGQSLIPERYFSLGDAYANALGAVLISPWYLLRPYVEFTTIRNLFSQFE